MPRLTSTNTGRKLKKELSVVERFAKQHGKLVAVTETGAANDTAPGDNQTALLRTGNGNKDWYNQALDIVSESEASYFLLWANFSKKDGFYTPYVDTVNANGSLHGHEMLDHFISFYNDNRSIFAANQKDVLTSDALGNVTARSDLSAVQGYLITPLPAARILKGTDVKAKITLYNAGSSKKPKLLIVAKTDKGKVKLTPKEDGKGMYTAKITSSQLKTLGKKVGTLALYINDRRVQRYSVIYNIKAPKEDPYLIDGFENYYGIDDQLAGAWTVNADTGCKVELSLSKEKKSDGNNGSKPVMVTIPFSEFCQRDTEGNPKGGLVADSNKIQSFGLWVNAVADSNAVVDGKVSGTLYYDSITAVKSPVKEFTLKAVK